jgi:flagellar basal body-associated protein FliL
MGFLVALISMVLVFVLMLPLMGIMYFDILSAKQETKDEVEKSKKLRKQLEESMNKNE